MKLFNKKKKIYGPYGYGQVLDSKDVKKYDGKSVNLNGIKHYTREELENYKGEDTCFLPMGYGNNVWYVSVKEIQERNKKNHKFFDLLKFRK